MKNEILSPKNLHKPQGLYSHALRVPPNAEWLVIAGQVGVDPKGKLAAGARRQSEQACRNILACLKANKMTKEHLVKLVVYLTDARGIEGYRAGRRKILGDSVVPPSTLVVIDGLAAPDMLVEIEAWAAKA